VPLSEDEQRILHQIERQFHQERGLARSLRVPADSREAARNAKRAAGGFVLGLLALSLSFAFSWVLGLVGFFVMLATGVALVQSLRRLARDRWRRGGRDRDGGGPQIVGPEPWGRPRRQEGGRWWSVGGRPSGKDDEDLS
jgi:predicted PurR-regulated permease PerM